MSFADLTKTLDLTCLSTFGVQATFQPQSLEPPTDITGIIAPPPLMEDFVPGGADGVSFVYFFVRFEDITPNPRKGDTVAIDGVTYNVEQINVDTQGSSTLKLRRKR
jgi:hypothetical protein